jgi:protein-disulfide isomerase
MLRYFALPLLCAALACSDADRSPAADVPATDVRRFSPDKKASTPDVMLEAADRGRVLGKDSARVWVIVVSDFQCPFCKTWHDETLPTLRSEYVETGKVRLAYMNYPLREHKHAVAAASAAMCASAQGKFWEAHDRIFAAQDRWSGADGANATLDSLATVAGVDPQKLRECTLSGRLLRLIRADIDRSEQSGARATPTFIIGNHRIVGAAPIATFRAAIDSALAGK